MVAKIRTVAFRGIDVLDIDVEVQIANGLPSFTIVGLPDKAVAESKERVRAALHAMGLALPAKRMTINLAPADVNKEGSHYDLPIALGLLVAMDVVPQDAVERYYALGELGLDGSLRPVTGVLPAAIQAEVASFGLICPAESGREAAWAGELDILAPQHLLGLINHFKGTQVLARPKAALPDMASSSHLRDLATVKGQETAKRALEITAAGGHNLLMVGPPGSGKSMLASCLPSLLPPLTPREALETSIIHSLAGTLPDGGLLRTRPYRDPHHSASQPALVGGGHKAKPGEISLAHHGVLFLDELPEFAKATLESLRQPLETGETLVARVNYHVTYPARFQLIAAMNPCRCGYFGQPEEECTKAPRCAEDYQSKLSGPLLDRIDLQVDVPPLSINDLSSKPSGETSAQVALRVARARDIQTARFAALSAPEKMRVNAHAEGKILEQIAPLDEAAEKMMKQAAEKLKLSARSWFRMLRVARTIADLDNAPDIIASRYIAEALSYRRLRLADL
jgi:magnesium chelatase family protein